MVEGNHLVDEGIALEDRPGRARVIGMHTDDDRIVTEGVPDLEPEVYENAALGGYEGMRGGLIDRPAKLSAWFSS